MSEISLSFILTVSLYNFSPSLSEELKVAKSFACCQTNLKHICLDAHNTDLNSIDWLMGGLIRRC